jgi:hypothetical protein
VSQKTYERYESIVRVHLSPALGGIRLKALTPDHVRGLYREKLDSGLLPEACCTSTARSARCSNRLLTRV